MQARPFLLVGVILGGHAVERETSFLFGDVGKELSHRAQVRPIEALARILLASSKLVTPPSVSRRSGRQNPIEMRSGGSFISRKDILTFGSLATIFSPESSLAKYGDMATLGLGDYDSVERNAFGDGDKNAYLASRVKVGPMKDASIDRWKAMVTEVRKQMQRSPPAYALAASAITSTMQTLKTDMRLVSKVLEGGGGEIIDGRSFDYVSGKFTLPPTAAQAEALFSEVNNAYFLANPRIRDDPKKCLTSIDKADAIFSKWVSMVEESIAKP